MLCKGLRARQREENVAEVDRARAMHELFSSAYGKSDDDRRPPACFK